MSTEMSTTATKSKKNKKITRVTHKGVEYVSRRRPSFYNKRLEKLAEFLMKVPPKLFNLSTFVDVENAKYKPEFAVEALRSLEPDCGSSGCALGFCPVVFPRLVEWDVEEKGSETVRMKRVCGEGFEVGVNLFALTENESNYLFNTSSYSDDGNNKPTAKDVARKIRHFLRYGIPTEYTNCWDYNGDEEEHNDEYNDEYEEMVVGS